MSLLEKNRVPLLSNSIFNNSVNNASIILRPSQSSVIGRSSMLNNWLRNPLEHLKQRASSDRAGSWSVIKYQKPKEFRIQFFVCMPCRLDVLFVTFNTGSAKLSFRKVQSLFYSRKVAVCCSKEEALKDIIIYLHHPILYSQFGSIQKYIQQSPTIPHQFNPACHPSKENPLLIVPQQPVIYDTSEPWKMECEQKERIDYYLYEPDESLEEDYSSANGDEIEEDPMKTALLRLAKETLEYIQSHQEATDELSQLKSKLYKYCSSTQAS
ncbi:hypothetical protein G6F37_008747 [Rhizopus arrhizus]|nr:hypothetical protein G6F38_011477 [Rhizopus arrhizus]KAG1155215.1 hypothetical protein G6F37_008747 [Rhizopus arrhizus]